MTGLFFVSVMVVSAAVSMLITLPIRRKVEALESMVEMLSKAVRGEYTKEN